MPPAISVSGMCTHGNAATTVDGSPGNAATTVDGSHGNAATTVDGSPGNAATTVDGSHGSPVTAATTVDGSPGPSSLSFVNESLVFITCHQWTILLCLMTTLKKTDQSYMTDLRSTKTARYVTFPRVLARSAKKLPHR